ncbi:EscF/YscF/HrpA family type III secretion system needle major subunit [Pantoea sp. 18069]|uniref:EscF/YscF/HrpA family type III secretion system needle major subunit n=1 Tax=Pantoea sp. 18069 TaxID=2681415 RepID=UPI0013596F81|nr:EscF/YscF/HrpA family type III secretion system needle major subunit [Pantoea sp. 18069]
MNNTTGLTFNAISSTIAQVTSSREASLKATLSEMGDSPSTADMLKMQQEVQQWSMFTQIQSTIVKELSDALKGVIQKAA